MGKIQSGATTDLLTVDPTSKAARVTLYDSSGNELILLPTEGSFLSNILLRQSATTAADSLVWSLFNTSSTVKMRIRSIRQIIMFDGTTAAATTRAYYWQRTGTAAPTGGSTITPTKKRSGSNASVADLRFVDTGLTRGSNASVGSPFIKLATPISVTGNAIPFLGQFHVMAERLISPIELGQNEGIGLFLNEQTTIGFGTAGVVEWDESTT